MLKREQLKNNVDH